MAVSIIGAGGHAKVVADAIISENMHSIRSFHESEPSGKTLWNYPILGLDQIKSRAHIVVAIGDNKTRNRIASELYYDKQVVAVCVIHPQAIVSSHAKVQSGAMIMAGAIVQASAFIDRHVIVNTGASVDHDCTVERAAHIGPHATLCGGVFVGARAFIGAGAVVLPGVHIGVDAVIGAGAVVTKDVRAGATVLGVPARSM